MRIRDFFDEDEGVMRADNSKCVNCHRCVTLCPTNALKITLSDLAFKRNANWSDEAIREIYRQAGSGGMLLSSMGTPRPYPVYWDKILINASQVTNPVHRSLAGTHGDKSLPGQKEPTPLPGTKTGISAPMKTNRT